MEKLSLNKNWICYVTGKRETQFATDVPHDAMLLDELRHRIILMREIYIYRKNGMEKNCS